MKMNRIGLCLRPALCPTLLVLGLLVHGESWAQQAPGVRPDAGFLLRQYEVRPTDVPLRRGVVTEEPPPSRGQAFGDEHIKVIPSAFRLTGVKTADEAELQKLLAPLVGKRAGFDQLQYAADLVTAYYRSKGFVTSRAYLPQQPLSAAGDPVEIEIAVLEGRYGKVRLENKSRVKDEVVRGMLAIKEGEPVKIEPVERGLLLIEDLPGARVISSTFAPGANLGESDYIAAIGDEAAVTGRATLDNFGLRVTGRLRAGVQASWQSPSRIGDAVDASLTTTGAGVTNGRVAYSLPVGTKGWRAQASVSRVEYTLGQEFKDLDYSGHADVVGVSVSHALVRERSLNLTLTLNAEAKRFGDSTRNGRQDKGAQLMSLVLNGDETDAFGGGGTTAWSYSGSFGRVSMRNEAAQQGDLAGAAGHFSRYNVSFSRLQALERVRPGLMLQTTISSQYAPKNLESSEKMILGGPNGVRAHPQAEGAGDRGWLASVELRQQLDWVSGWRNWASVFYDAGGVQILAKPVSEDDNTRLLRGYGVGMGADYNGKYYVSAAVAKPVGEKPLDAPEAGRSLRGWIQLGATY